ncbi:MAG: hypothetical protein GWN84_12410 [Gammaproteobacteria bacterium]|nr:hypothetical protein [Gammaproteobacteria bacterium]NIR83709.1 hypothetical protein [Gammaproteobacteria bacterium]NIR91856.1 hypothetical protein [Gammaproteobacteria bacterium]NIU04875.1 hypothetical protein [Gammaproteobacteria bacterium]NIV51857.1 hypothetical protein [Gammaproteobacteria bacterium]
MRLEHLEPADLVEWSPRRRPLWGVYQAAHLLLGWKPPALSQFKDPLHYFGSLEPKKAARRVEALYDLLKVESERGGKLKCRRVRIGQRDDVRPLRRVSPGDVARLAQTQGIRIHQHVLRMVACGIRDTRPDEAEWSKFLVRMHDELEERLGATPIYSHVLNYAHAHSENHFIRRIDWRSGELHRHDSREPLPLKSAYRALAEALRQRSRG